MIVEHYYLHIVIINIIIGIDYTCIYILLFSYYSWHVSTTLLVNPLADVSCSLDTNKHFGIDAKITITILEYNPFENICAE